MKNLVVPIKNMVVSHSAYGKVILMGGGGDHTYFVKVRYDFEISEMASARIKGYDSEIM